MNRISILLLMLLLSFKSAIAAIPLILSSLENNIQQAIIVEEQLTTWEYKQGSWQAVYEPMNIAIGRNGLAPLDEKKEGDGRTPGGIFFLKTAFGYSSFVETGLSYRQATDQDFWIDDVESAQYNQWVNGEVQANSFERMKRDDDLYKYGIVIEYNVDPIVPGKGSAIFIHVWRNEDSPTAGCVALSEDNMIKILKWLDKDKNPVIILGRE